MKACYMTDSGRVRSHNEDSVTILKNASDEFLLVVADGMGGHRKGEVASSIVVSHLGKRFNETPSMGTKLDAVNWLNDNINEINQEILEYGEKNIDSKGLGTTIVVALLTKEYLIFGNIGDSSGFVIKNNKLHKVTHDHTLVNLLVDAGNLTEDEAKIHPKKNVLMKALGATTEVDVDIFDCDMSVSEILLSSDGLTGMLDREQIEKVLIGEGSPKDKVVRLINKANNRGGTDNISVAYLICGEGDE